MISASCDYRFVPVNPLRVVLARPVCGALNESGETEVSISCYCFQACTLARC